MSYIIFEEQGASTSGKTKIWHVLQRTGAFLGKISWYAAWRKYVFAPDGGSIYDPDCMDEISSFVRTRTLRHKDANYRLLQLYRGRQPLDWRKFVSGC